MLFISFLSTGKQHLYFPNIYKDSSKAKHVLFFVFVSHYDDQIFKAGVHSKLKWAVGAWGWGVTNTLLIMITEM